MAKISITYDYQYRLCKITDRVCYFTNAAFLPIQGLGVASGSKSKWPGHTDLHGNPTHTGEENVILVPWSGRLMVRQETAGCLILENTLNWEESVAIRLDATLYNVQSILKKYGGTLYVPLVL